MHAQWYVGVPHFDECVMCFLIPAVWFAGYITMSQTFLMAVPPFLLFFRVTAAVPC